MSPGRAPAQPLDYTPQNFAMNQREILFRWDEIPLDKVTEMISTKVVAGSDSRVTQAYLKKGSLVPLHRHDAEWMVYVLQGALRLSVDGQDVTVREGETAIVPAGARQQLESLDDTFVMTFRGRA